MAYPTLKVVLCGDFGVGKSSIFRRFVYDNFVESSDRASTLGFDHFEKLYEVEGKQLKIQLWDTGGLERVASITSNYFKFAEAAILVFAWDAVDSFNAMSQHMLDVLTYSENARVFVCGNKSDLFGQGMGPSEAQVNALYAEYAINDGDNLIKQMYRVSCKTREGVHEMIDDIARRLARSIRTEPAPNLDHFQLKGRDLTEKSSCCSNASNGNGE